MFGLLQGDHLGLGQDQTLLSHLASKDLQALVHILQIVPLPHKRTPAGETFKPSFFNSLDTRT